MTCSGDSVWRLAKLANENGIPFVKIADVLEVSPALVQQKVREL